MKILLNLGTGRVPAVPPKGATSLWVVINHDLMRHSPFIDVAWNLERRPWPWEPDSITIIRAYSVLEHLSISLLDSLNECWRILKPGGRLDIKLPLWDKEETWNDPTHRWQFGHEALNLFDPTTERGKRYQFYGAKPWRILSQQVPARGTSLYGSLEKIK
jgi:SAM-dependent methyltransferase